MELKRASRWTYATIVLVSLAFYLLLGRKWLYGDSHGLLVAVGNGTWISGSAHFLLCPVLNLLWIVAEPLGLTLFQTASLLMAGSTAFGLALLYAASLQLGLDSKKATQATLLVGLSPAISFYAGSIEYHAFFFFFSCLATFAATRLFRKPTVKNATLVGFATGLATQAHGTGILLPILFGLWFFGFRSTSKAAPTANPTNRTVVALLFVVALAHFTFTIIDTAWKDYAGLLGSNTSRSMDVLLDDFQRTIALVASLPLTIWKEWALPFFPLSLTLLSGCFVSPFRKQSVYVTLGVLIYVVASFMVLKTITEYGAYFLPMAWACAVVTVRVFGQRVCIGLILISLAGSIGQVIVRDRQAESQTTAEVMLEASEGQPITQLVSNNLGTELHFIWLPDEGMIYLPKFLRFKPQKLLSVLPALDAEIEQRIAEGHRVFITEQGLDFFSSNPTASESVTATMLLNHLQDQYVLDGIPAEDPRVWRLLPLVDSERNE